MRIRRSIHVVIAAILVATAGTPLHGADPRTPGPYPVGVRTEILVDSARTCAITHQPRTLVTEIWYPAADSVAPVNRFAQFWPGANGATLGKIALAAFGGNFMEIDQQFKNSAHRGARIADREFPLLVFSHGNGGFRFQNTFQMEYLASHGYIIAACDHTGNAAITLLPKQPVLYNKQTIKDVRRWDDRPRDLAFLIREVTRLSDTSSSWLHSKVERGNYGALGHSFGGFSVCRLTELDHTVKAIMPMTVAGTLYDIKDLAASDPRAAALSPRDMPNMPCAIPLMILLADHDQTVDDAGNERSRNYYNRAQGPRALAVFKGAGHFTFTDMPQINANFGDGVGADRDKNGKPGYRYSDAVQNQRITNQYSAAFFNAFLKSDRESRKFLNENHFPKQIEYQHQWTHR